MFRAPTGGSRRQPGQSQVNRKPSAGGSSEAARGGPEPASAGAHSGLRAVGPGLPVMTRAGLELPLLKGSKGGRLRKEEGSGSPSEAA